MSSKPEKLCRDSNSTSEVGIGQLNLSTFKLFKQVINRKVEVSPGKTQSGLGWQSKPLGLLCFFRRRSKSKGTIALTEFLGF